MATRAGDIYTEETESEQSAEPGYEISMFTVTHFFQQSSVSHTIHNFPKEYSQLGGKYSSRLAYGGHIFKPHDGHILGDILLTIIAHNLSASMQRQQ